MADIKVSSNEVQLELRIEYFAHSCPGILGMLNTSPLEECRLRVDPRSGSLGPVARRLWLVVVLELLEQSQQRESTAIPCASIFRP